MQRSCDLCGTPYEAKRSTSKFCGSGCRARASQGAVTPLRASESVSVAHSGLVEATRRELEEAGRLETALGQAAVLLAERIEAGRDPGSAVAALTREWGAKLEAATANAKRAASPLDELRAKRRQKLGA